MDFEKIGIGPFFSNNIGLFMHFLTKEGTMLKGEKGKFREDYVKHFPRTPLFSQI